jgi:exonuclease SbcC
MLPRRLYIEDFLIHRLSDIDFTLFSSALIVAVDKNNPNESNGVGKTSILRAIDYALFGMLPKGATLEKIVRDGCDRCKVIFEFESCNDIYKIERSRSNISNKSELKLYKSNNGWDEISGNSIAATEADLLKIIKISKIAFNNAVLFAQSDLSGLATASPKQRREILKEPLQLFAYKSREKVAKERYTTTSNKLDIARKSIDNLGDPETDIVSANIDIKNTKSELKDSKSKLEKAQTEFYDKKLILSDLEVKISSDAQEVHKNLSDIKNKKKKTENQLYQSELELTKHNNKIAEVKLQIESKDKELSLFNAELIKLNSLIIRSAVSVKKDIDSINTSAEKGVILIAEIEKELRTLKTPLPEEDVCNSCKQPITEEHRKACKEKTDARISELNETLTKYKNKLVKIRERQNDLSQELKDISKHDLNVNTVSNKINSIEESILLLKNNIISYEEDLISKIENIENIKLSINEIIITEGKLTEEAKKLSIDQLNADIFSTKNELELINKNIISLNKLIASLQSKKGALDEKISIRTKDKSKIFDLKKDADDLQKIAKTQQRVVQGFSANGIPSMLINNILDDLQIEVNNILLELKPSLQIEFVIGEDSEEDELRMNFLIDKKERDWELVSGGQKMDFAFALKLGLSRVIQHRIGVDIKFLELDEVDQPLDKAAVDALSDIIKSLHDKMKILVITHNDWLKDKFTHAILVEKDGNNGSTAKVVSSW